MSTDIKKVVLTGASGTVGAPILNALLAAKTFQITVLSRKDSKASFPNSVLVRRLDYEDSDALLEAFKDQDAVVASVAFASLDVQARIIEAAWKAGVKGFIPSDFGSSLEDDKILKLVTSFQPKQDAVDLLRTYEKKGMTWTAVINGPFFDWGIRNGFLGVDATTKTSTLFDHEAPSAFTTTTLSTVGAAVVGVLRNPGETANRRVYVSSFTLTCEELCSAVERVTGEAFKTVKKSTQDVEKEGREMLSQGNFYGEYSLIQVSLFRQGFGADFGLRQNDNKLLGLEDEDLDTVLKGILA